MNKYGLSRSLVPEIQYLISMLTFGGFTSGCSFAGGLEVQAKPRQRNPTSFRIHGTVHEPLPEPGFLRYRWENVAYCVA